VAVETQGPTQKIIFFVFIEAKGEVIIKKKIHPSTCDTCKSWYINFLVSIIIIITKKEKRFQREREGERETFSVFIMYQ
jgi:hypothetical protein